MPAEEISASTRILLTKEVIECAFKNDLGPEWNLIDYERREFTKKGDNYMSVIATVNCSGTSNGLKRKTYYIAKLNPLRQTSAIDDTTANFFFKEGSFLTQLSGTLNKILNDIGHPVFNVPECVYFSFTRGKEILISRDLRKRGFQMYDASAGINLNHSELVVKELAKLHSSSVVLKTSLKHDMLDSYPFLKDEWLVLNSNCRVLQGELIKTQIKITIKLIQQIPDYDKHRKWLESIQDTVGDQFFQHISESTENMRVVCHGDCWNNNMLFRYDTEGNPVEVALLDLQICRYGSVSLDLMFLFYSSLTGEIRNTYIDHLLSVYYKEFQDVLTAAKIDTMPFTEDQLQEDISNKSIFGVIAGLHLLPFIFNEGDDGFDFNQVKDRNEIQQGLQVLSKSTFKLFETNPVFKSRLLAVLDDAVKLGLVE